MPREHESRGKSAPLPSSTTPDPPVIRPRLPIPPLSATMMRYLESAKPFLREHARKSDGDYEGSLSRYSRIVQDFESAVGRTLQERLNELDRKSPRNWLEDNFWLDKAYLEWRAPVVINTNWWLAFIPDDVLEKRLQQETRDGPNKDEVNRWQIARAAWMTNRMLEFYDRLENQEIYPESTKEGLWFREAAMAAFNVCRIPRIPKDVLSSRPAPYSTPDARKIVVCIRNWLYAVTVYEGVAEKGFLYGRLSWRGIERRLHAVVRDVRQRAERENAVPVGILSSDGRDQWAKNLAYLLSISPTNQRIYNTIQQSLFALSLDSGNSPITSPVGTEASSATTPGILSHLLSVRSSYRGQNRWFDKGMTLIVDPSGDAGMMGEHSPVDALIPSMISEYALVEQVPKSELSAVVVADDEGWERLDWTIDARVAEACREAQGRVDEVIAASDYAILHFTGYGSQWIKTIAQFSPDAYIQMALQLAWYNTHGQTFTATYETALTRNFDAGRTETIRTFTEESRQWVLAMCNPALSAREKLGLLSVALKKHVELTRSAASGRGIDRHLLGLRMMVKPGQEAEEAGKLFDSPLFQQSAEWKLSTSGLSAGNFFRGTGFGASYQDGYGINYLAGNDIVKFGIETKTENSHASAAAFAQEVGRAMEGMQELVLHGLSEKPRL